MALAQAAGRRWRCACWRWASPRCAQRRKCPDGALQAGLNADARLPQRPQRLLWRRWRPPKRPQKVKKARLGVLDGSPPEALPQFKEKKKTTAEDTASPASSAAAGTLVKKLRQQGRCSSRKRSHFRPELVRKPTRPKGVPEHTLWKKSRKKGR